MIKYPVPEVIDFFTSVVGEDYGLYYNANFRMIIPVLLAQAFMWLICRLNRDGKLDKIIPCKARRIPLSVRRKEKRTGSSNDQIIITDCHRSVICPDPVFLGLGTLRRMLFLRAYRVAYESGLLRIEKCLAQSSKASFPISVTLSGIVISRRFGQP